MKKFRLVEALFHVRHERTVDLGLPVCVNCSEAWVLISGEILVPDMHMVFVLLIFSHFFLINQT
jgi:hypothetical protein